MKVIAIFHKTNDTCLEDRHVWFTDCTPPRDDDKCECGEFTWLRYFNLKANEDVFNQYPYFINCGGFETMERLAQYGRKALNPKTMRYQLISKTAKYLVVLTGTVESEDYGVQWLGDLYCNEDLKQIAEDKGLTF